MSAKTSQGPLLDEEKVLAILKKEGPIGSKLKLYEERNEQKEILKKIVSAFNSQGIALIEAGTGTGKSLSYLIPSILAATIFKERVVISTHTIALQEQILHKDLPLVLKALNIDLKATLVKGMHNYICLRKVHEVEFEKMLMTDEEERNALDKLQLLSREGKKGCKSELPFQPAPKIWEMVAAEHDTCNNIECPYYNDCYYVEARKQAQDAQVLIVNHHLLLSDLMARKEVENYTNPMLLPAYSRIILDEAHHIEEIATEYLAEKLNRLELLKTLSRLTTEKHHVLTGKIPEVKSILLKGLNHQIPTELSNLLSLDLPGTRKDLLKALADFFLLIDQFFDAIENKEENKFRLRKEVYETALWKEKITPLAQECVGMIKRYVRELERLEETVKEIDHPRLMDKCKGPLHDIKALGKKLLLKAQAFELLIFTPPPKTSIRWIEAFQQKNFLNTLLVNASLDISETIYEALFAPFKSVVLLSATLTAGGSFSFIRDRLGLGSKKPLTKPLIECRSESPFNYKTQTLLLTPKDLPDPNAANFIQEASKVILEAVEASRGNTFVLFTSYEMLKTCYNLLVAPMKTLKLHPLKQGDESRQALLRRFVQNEGSVLFGTSSFWEGVDVVGEALRSVIITKLPFQVPSDPLIQARSEAIEEEGGNPFKTLLLPHAAIKLKQGFGRLIRNKYDRGCILCLDTRIISKNYGKYLLDQLPPCPHQVIERKELKKTMIDFYQKTSYLVKNQSNK